MKKRVAHVIYDLATAGAQTVVMNYLRSMKNDCEYEHFVVVGNSYSGLQYEEEAKAKGYNVVYANYKPVVKSRAFRPFINWFRYQTALYRALKLVNPDIVHTHLTQILPFVSIPILLLQKRKLHTLHSDPYAISMRFYLFAIIAFHIFRFKVIGVTEEQAEKAKKRYYLNNIPVVHNGLYLEQYNICNSRYDIRKELNIANDAFVVGTVGRLFKIKNYPFLIKVFAEFANKNPKAILVIVGDGNERNHLESIVREYNISEQVIFTGQRKDVVRIYHTMDLFMMTSFFESSSIVTVEAQACGVRCVIADSIPENVIVTNNVSRLSLDAPLDDWLSAMYGNYERHRKISDISLFSMDRTIIELKNIYKSIDV